VRLEPKGKRDVADTVLVTGASGFVGSRVARALVARGYGVRVLLRPTASRRNLTGLPVEMVYGGLDERPALDAALHGCAALVHVAADYRLWAPDPGAMMRCNVDGTRAVMEAAQDAGVTRIVHTSSVATLAPCGDAPADETAWARLDDMVGPYKRSKFLAEKLVRAMVAERGLPAVMVNPSTPLGPGDLRPTPTGRMVVEAARGRMPAYVDTGLNIVHVDDVAMGHVLALERGRVGERYVLGGEDMALSQVLAAIATQVGRPPPRWRVPLAAVVPVALAAEAWGRVSGGEPFVTLDSLRMARHRMYFSSAKAERELGYTHRPAAQAIAAAVEWFRQQGMLG
jgi:dihydroflavonol-4-reductase